MLGDIGIQGEGVRDLNHGGWKETWNIRGRAISLLIVTSAGAAFGSLFNFGWGTVIGISIGIIVGTILSSRLAFVATVSGCGAGTAGALLGGFLACWPFAVVCAVFGGPIGVICGIAVTFIRNGSLAWAVGLGLASGFLAGFALGLYFCSHAPL